jgi:hypothetical protein
MARNNNRSRNNNPSGRNQYSSDWMDAVKDRPMTAAATAAAAVGAGIFLWSKRNALSEQMSNLSDQISEWTDNMRTGSSSDDFGSEFETTGSTATKPKRSSRKSQQEISEEALSIKETGAA